MTALKPFKPIPKHRPDLLTYVVRFLFGTGLGALLGYCVGIRSPFIGRTFVLNGETDTLFLFVGGVALFFGIGTTIFGDRIWGGSA